MEVHHLKTVQPWWDYVASGKKTFEVRKNDRDFRAGDILILHQYPPEDELHPEFETIAVSVEIILDAEDVRGIQPGYCVMGITKIEKGEKRNHETKL